MLHTPQDATIMTSAADRSVRVEFYDNQSGELMIVRHMSAHDLPDDFDRPTVLDLGLGSWHVSRAQPSTSAQFVADGVLRLWLDRPSAPRAPSDFVQANDLFAPITIAPLQGLDIVDHHQENGDDLWLYEEDWRQNEVICHVHAQRVQEQLDRIARTAPGLTYTRAPIEGALGGVHLQVDALADALGQGCVPFDGVVIVGADDRVRGTLRDAFALETARATVFYGTHDAQGALTALAIHDWESPQALAHDLMALAAALSDDPDDWLLVSWLDGSRALIGECIVAH